MSERILVTGAGGYLGCHAMHAVRDTGREAAGVVRTRAPSGGEMPVAASISECDLSDLQNTVAMMSRVRPAAVIHAAAWIGVGPPTPEMIARAITDNVSATANVAAAAVQCGVRRLVFCSSVEVYAGAPRNGCAHMEEDTLDPQGLYGQTKALCERTLGLIADSGIETVVLRMPGIHGGGRASGIVHKLWSCAVAGRPVDLPEPETRLSFLWVKDAARVAAAAATGQLTGTHGTFNVASGSASLSELADIVGKRAGRDIVIRAGTAEPRNRTMDVTRLTAALPFRIPPFAEGLERSSFAVAP